MLVFFQFIKYTLGDEQDNEHKHKSTAHNNDRTHPRVISMYTMHDCNVFHNY